MIRMRRLPLSIALIALPILAGCASRGDDEPRDRLGALPYPGPMTLYESADPAALGQHRYESKPRWFHTDETEHGIIYTTRAGFVDLAHMRITIDLARYCTEHVRRAIRNGASSVPLETLEGSVFFVNLHFPDNWPPRADDPRELAIADEVAIRTGQRIAYRMMVWHEFITWFGYRSVAFLDESPSAFTYDDTMSHVIGLRVAGRALRDKSPGRSYDEAVTLALNDELANLGAVSPAETDRAADAVERTWWTLSGTSTRNLAIGLDDDPIRPWLVPGFDPDHTAPAAFELPSLKNVAGRDFSGFYSIAIDPRIFVAWRIRHVLPNHPALIDCDRDYPILLHVTGEQMRERAIATATEPPSRIRLAATTMPADREAVRASMTMRPEK